MEGVHIQCEVQCVSGRDRFFFFITSTPTADCEVDSERITDVFTGVHMCEKYSTVKGISESIDSEDHRLDRGN